MDKIMITGGTGFIGRHIVEYFSAQGEDIHAVTRSEADIKDYDSLVAAFAGADCVIHNAALANIGETVRIFIIPMSPVPGMSSMPAGSKGLSGLF